MAEIIEFEACKNGTSLIVVTVAGIYCGNFQGYTQVGQEQAIMLENCKLYLQTNNSKDFFELKNSIILLRHVVSLTSGTI